MGGKVSGGNRLRPFCLYLPRHLLFVSPSQNNNQHIDSQGVGVEIFFKVIPSYYKA